MEEHQNLAYGADFHKKDAQSRAPNLDKAGELPPEQRKLIEANRFAAILRRSERLSMLGRDTDEPIFENADSPDLCPKKDYSSDSGRCTFCRSFD